MSLSGWTYAPPNTPVDQLTSGQYTEAKGTETIDSAPGSGGVTRIFYITWNVIPAFLDDLLGFPSLGAAVLGVYPIERDLPDQHPLFLNYYAMEAKVEGIGILGHSTSPSIATYTAAKVTATYKAVDFSVEDDEDIDTELDRFITRTFAYSAEFLTINNVGMKFVGSGKLISQPPARITQAVEMTYTWHNVPAKPADPFTPPNLTNATACLGMVNSVAFDPDNMDCPPGTVLFLGYDPKLTTPRITTGALDNNFQWEITHKFLYRNNGVWFKDGTTICGHNFIYDQGNKRWDLVTADGTATGNPLYQSIDLNTVFEIT